MRRCLTALAFFLPLANFANPAWTEHRRALLLGAINEHLAETLANKGFVVTRSPDGREYEHWLRSIPTNGVGIIYYSGKLDTGLANDKKSVVYSFQLANYASLPPAHDPESVRNPRPEEPALSTKRLGDRLARNCARVNLVVIACQGIEGEGKAYDALRAISGGNRVFSAMAQQPGDSAANALTRLLTDGAVFDKQEFHTVFPRDQKFSLQHQPAEVCAPPDKPQRGRIAGDQWVDPNGIDFVWCPAATFTMGDAEFADAQPVEVTLSKGFWMGKYELTRGQSGLLTGSEGSFFSGRERYQPAQWGNTDNGIEGIRSWTAYQEKVGLALQDWSYDLPTEAEWEYACRAGNAAVFPAAEKDMGQFANFADRRLYDDNETVHYIYASQLADDGYAAALAHVGQFQPNAWGLHDMLGNVAELVGDFYSDSLAGGTDPIDQLLRTSRDRRRVVIRGGAWCSPVTYLHVAHRSVFPGTRLPYAGTRLVLREGAPVCRSSKALQAEVRVREEAAKKK